MRGFLVARLMIGLIMLTLSLTSPAININQYDSSSTVSYRTTAGYDWPMFCHDLSRTGYSDSLAPNNNSLSWSFKTGGWVDSSPAVADGRVYVGTRRNNKIYCLNATTGQLLWSYVAGGDVYSPAVADGRVFVGALDRKVHCLNATSGQLVWSFNTGGLVLSSPAVADSKVYVGSQNRRVFCLNASNGAFIWSFQTVGSVNSSPAVVNGRVYVGASTSQPDFRVYCLDASTGTHIWNYTTGSAVDSSPTVVDGRVYVGSQDYEWSLYCLNATTGERIWRYRVYPHVGMSSPAVAYGRVFIPSSAAESRIYCLDAITRELVWRYDAGTQISSSPAVADGKVYVGTVGLPFNVLCLNASTGEVVWSYQTDNSVWSSPAVAYGRVYVGSVDKRLYVFGPPIHEIAVVGIKPSKTVVSQGYPVSVDVYVDNQGGYAEDFHVMLYVNGSYGGMAFAYNASYCETAVVSVVYSTAGCVKGTYTFRAAAPILQNELDNSDNWLVDGVILVTIPGDVDGDREVDIYDIVRMSGAYEAQESDPEYDPCCDIDSDGDVDIYDIVIAAGHYGESW